MLTNWKLAKKYIGFDGDSQTNQQIINIDKWEF